MTAVLLVAIITACGGSGVTTIADAELDGFTRNQQQGAALIGAADGWSGDWAGDRVELYEYTQDINTGFFEQTSTRQPWVTWCSNGQLAMLSTGQAACDRLTSLNE